MSDQTLLYLAGSAAVMGLMAYAVFAGADFGGGVWDLFSTAPRKQQQRDAIAHAMGPVWEANHVWLIFVLVVLFTCFPNGYELLSERLFLPFHLALLGIMLRGAAFVFRANAKGASGSAFSLRDPTLWQHIFGIASVISPFVLGCAFGAVTAGDIQSSPVGAARINFPPWLRPYSISCGLLALSTCAYLAAVYLCVETDGTLRDDFRKRAIIAGTSTAALAFLCLLLAYEEANWFFKQMIAPQTLPVIIAGLVAFAASAFAVFTRRYRAARICAATEIVLLLLGWAIAQQPYLIYPDHTLHSAAAPAQTIRFTLATVPVGLALLLPSLYLLFRVFKGSPEA